MPAVASPILAIDASVAIPLVLKNHEAHRAVAHWCAERRLPLCGHAAIETYAVLTRLPGTARVAPEDAIRLLETNFAEPLVTRSRSLKPAVELFARLGIAGGATYDALVALAALEHQAVLASRDARAEATYRRFGVEVEMVPSSVRR